MKDFEGISLEIGGSVELVKDLPNKEGEVIFQKGHIFFDIQPWVSRDDALVRGVILKNKKIDLVIPKEFLKKTNRVI